MSFLASGCSSPFLDVNHEASCCCLAHSYNTRTCKSIFSPPPPLRERWHCRAPYIYSSRELPAPVHHTRQDPGHSAGPLAYPKRAYPKNQRQKGTISKRHREVSPALFSFRSTRTSRIKLSWFTPITGELNPMLPIAEMLIILITLVVSKLESISLLDILWMDELLHQLRIAGMMDPL